ncbi:MAG: CHAP domain-containing protein [Flavobacterium sp.]|uniref:CHAP domain-containing protein n=1 Tax=Flavobacterium sp. TaxID=239 RepID=UPI00326639BD
MKKIIFITTVIIVLFFILKIVKEINWNSKHEVGEILDNYNDVKVYYNGGVSNTEGRNMTKDGYNIGMKYQCVEFVKRYYYEHFNHKMPDTYGNAKDFFAKGVKDGEMNTKRDLLQYVNPSKVKPKVDDIIIFDKSILNSYGHVAIVSKVENNYIEIVQQNPGPFRNSRDTIMLKVNNNLWLLDNDRILGRLSK